MKNLKLIIFDIDNTLVYGPCVYQYYAQYPSLLEKTLADYLGITLDEAKHIADNHRQRFNGRGERAFETYSSDGTHWYNAICTLDPVPYIPSMHDAQEVLNNLRDKGYTLGAITDGPTKQSHKILNAACIDVSMFDFLIGWERGSLVPKGGRSDIFTSVMHERGLDASEILMVGDSLETDIIPAYRVGMRVAYIAQDTHKDFPTIQSIAELSVLIQNL
jgi:FMN phosphatase YigB (HAD superfamily)